MRSVCFGHRKRAAVRGVAAHPADRASIIGIAQQSGPATGASTGSVGGQDGGPHHRPVWAPPLGSRSTHSRPRATPIVCRPHIGHRQPCPQRHHKSGRYRPGRPARRRTRSATATGRDSVARRQVVRLGPPLADPRVGEDRNVDQGHRGDGATLELVAAAVIFVMIVRRLAVTSTVRSLPINGRNTGRCVCWISTVTGSPGVIVVRAQRAHVQSSLGKRLVRGRFRTAPRS